MGSGDVMRLVGVMMYMACVGVSGAQPPADVIVAALRPALPFPAASIDRELPEDNSAASRWFVVWPTTPRDTRIVVKANPLNVEVQRAGAEAMHRINESVAAAERRAQAAYEKALDEMRRTGTASDIEGVTLDDEGVAGERIDAELELVIEWHAAAPFEIEAGEPPQVAPGANGPAWVVSVPAQVYTVETMAGTREHFRAAESWLLFGALDRPVVVERPDKAVYGVSVTAAPGAFAVLLRGNAELLNEVRQEADWAALVPR